MSMENVFAVQAVMSLLDNITGPLQRIRGQMGDTGRDADQLGGRMGSLARAMMPIAMAAAIVVGGFGVCVAATMETQAALGELASVGITDMDALSSAAEDFSSQWAGTTKPEFIAAAYDIKSGIASLTDTGVAEFTKLAALTGKATKSSTSEMTSLFATGYGIYKGMYADLTDLQFGEVFSAGIAASVQAFKTSGSGMAQAISSLGATATTAKVPLEEQLSILGMLQATMGGGEAGTKYKAMMTSAAGAGEKLGLSFMDSNNQLLSMPAILNAMKGKYGDTLDAIEKMEIQKAFGTQEAVAVIDLFYDKIDDLEGNITSMGGAMQQGSAFTSDMADTMNRDLGSVLQIAGQRFHNLKEIIGNVFLPVVTPLVAGVGRIVDVLSAVARTTVGKTFILIAGGVGVAALAFTAFAAAGAALGVIVPFVTASLAPLGAAIAAISWPVWLIVGAVGVLALAWKNNFGGMADTFSGWWNKITLIFRGVKAVFASLTGTVGTIEGELATDIKAAGLVGLVTTVAKVVYRIREFFGGLWDGFSSAVDGISGILSPVVGSLVAAFRPLFSIISSVATVLFGATAATDASGWRTFGAVIGVVVGSAFRMLAWVIRLVATPLAFVARIMATFIVVSTGVSLAIKLWTGAQWLLNTALLKNPIGLVIVAIAALCGAVFAIYKYWEPISGFFSGLWGAVAEGVASADAWITSSFQAMGVWISGLVDSIVSFFTRMGEGIKWAFLNLTPVGWMVQAFTGIKGFLEGIDLSAAGAKLMGTITAGIKSNLMAPVEAVKGGFQKLRNLLPFSDAKEGPLSTLTLSGAKMMETLAGGVRSAAPALQAATAGALAGVAALTAVEMGTAEASVGSVQPQVMEMMSPAMLDLTGLASWQGKDVAAPVMPDLAGNAAWQAQEVFTPALPDLAGTAAWWAQDVVAPVLPEETESAGRLQPIGGAGINQGIEQEKKAASRPSSGGSSKKIVIQGLTLNLPNVTDGDSFARELQALVEQYDD